jgi:outer membrane scaffolding protein for murein synthesis (MipA/OmpV family)
MLMSVLAAEPLLAADIASDIREGDSAPDTSNGGYFEVGVGLHYADGGRLDELNGKRNDDYRFLYTLNLNYEYRYKGLFIEAASGSADGLNLGYNFWHNNYWTIDFLALSGGGDPDNDDLTGSPESERDAELIDRNFGFSGSGIRATGYLGEYILQYRLLADAFNDNGVVSTARAGRSWQVKNWNFHAIASLRYDSAKTNQRAFGITPEEATARFDAYTPSSSVSFGAEVGATYPLSEHWVFRTTARFVQQNKEAELSPLRNRKHGVSFNSSISYVFK